MQSPRSFKRKRKLFELEVELPKPPKKEEIAGWDLPKKDQRFRPPVIPENFSNLPEKDQLSFLRVEMDKRINGYWFYNNGNIEYMTGVHYFYCSYWRIDVGLPQWRDSDRDVFYFWDYCVNNKDCLGMIYIANRRSGKTYIGTNILYEGTTRKKNATSGIQSKTNKDAANVFRKLIRCWKQLPDFWKPVDSGDTNPKTSLNFEEPSVRRSKGQKKTYKNVLNSFIDYMPTVEEAYDGRALHLWYLDEFGKVVEANVYELWLIVKECFVSGATIKGKAFLSTTVEEMTKKGGKHAKEIWDESNPNELDELNQTKTGLYRYFKPAYFGLEGFIDEYGYSMVDEAQDYLKKKRNNLSGSALASERRKYPFFVEEAFRTDRDAVFDVNSIYEQLEYNDSQPSKVRRGNLIWITKDVSVRFMDDPNGRWSIYQLPEPSEVNGVKYNNGKKQPKNKFHYVSGVDPYDQSKTYSNKQSMAASYVFKMHNPMSEVGSNCFVAEYHGRPPKADMFFEDMIKQSVFYGTELLYERNRPGIGEYFERRGFGGFLMHRPGGKPGEKGIPMTGIADRELLVRMIQNYVYDYVGWIEGVEEEGRNGELFFDGLLNEWIDFDVDNWTPYDRTVASGLTLIAARASTMITEKQDGTRRGNYIPVREYNIKGRRY